ncbi:MAG TPA: TonB-dependent receptor [Azospirillaceae bacterium]|nr:TonB-dependent receptor [Azospirillaceae bacterium]
MLLAASLAAVAPALPAAAQGRTSGEVVVTGRRSGVPVYERPYGATIIGGEALETAPQRRLDEALRAVPGFGLFRRSGSTLANPTTQGVSLRGIGPNGAGRTLVLVDGVPVNDPFGGWVYWSRLPTSAAERIIITRGGGAGPWGNTALAGTVRIDTKPPAGAQAELSAGTDETFQALGSVGGPVAGGPARLGLTASAFSTGGAPVVRRDQRGPVDIDADADSYWVDAVGGAALGADIQATAKLSAFREHRGNGTRYTENATEALEGSLRLVGGGALPWEAVLYARDWDFRSTFSGVNAARTVETPSLDQFAVPARAYGGVVQLALPWGGGHETDIGADIRHVEGATNELFTFAGGDFTRVRRAGGEQTVAGLFAEHAWQAGAGLTLTGGLRLDRWRNADGERLERDRATGAVLRRDRFGTRDGTVLNGRAGAEGRLAGSLVWRAAAYTGFRLPTLNELYRPFRVGNDITEANPALEPERLVGGEVGLRAEPAAGLTLSATLFRSVLREGVDNVTIQDTPGLNPELGVFVPAGGSLAQRRGLDRVVIDGLEAELGWAPRPDLSFSLSYLFSDGEVERADEAPDLVGRRPAQAPRHQGTVEAGWRPAGPVSLRLQLRAASSAFEDGRNSRTLAPYVLADAYAGWDVTPALHLFATVENLADRTVETGRRSDGLTSIGPGRRAMVGARARW